MESLRGSRRTPPTRARPTNEHKGLETGTMAKLTAISDIDTDILGTLEVLGISDSDSLLERTRTLKDRIHLSADSGISFDIVEHLAHLVDLMRIDGITQQVAALLEVSGTRTVSELARRNPGNLSIWLQTVNRVKRLAPGVPSTDVLARWIEEAQLLAA